MAEEREFRIGDVPHELLGKTLPKAAPSPGLDKDSFPTLAAFLKAGAGDFRARLDALQARARQPGAPADLQAALQAAVRVLPEMYKVYGG